VEQEEQPSRSDVRAERMKMTPHERSVDTLSSKTHHEIQEYMNKRKSKSITNYVQRNEVNRQLRKLEYDVKEKKREIQMKQELPPRKKQLEWLKKKLKDEIPVLKGPVQIPSYINKMLSGLCGSKVITSEQVKLIEHILTSELKTNGDSVFRGMKSIKQKIEWDIEENNRSYETSWRPPPFKPDEYVRRLVMEEMKEAQEIRQHNKEILEKQNELLKEEQEEQQKLAKHIQATVQTN